MITYQEALERILAQARPIAETETIPLMYSTGRVLAEDIASPIDVPFVRPTLRRRAKRIPLHSP